MKDTDNQSSANSHVFFRDGVRESLVCGASFIALVVVGLAIFSDYGVSCDEFSHLQYGKTIMAYVFNGVPLPTNNNVVYYGPFFDTLSYAFLEMFRVEDSRSILLGKHLMTFLFFLASIIAFYRLCKRYFGNWVPAFAACLFLVAHPRIFAHSFFNPKDLPFLASLVIACATLLWFLDRKTAWRGALHGLATAICIDIRILGIMVPAMTLFFGALEVWLHPSEREAIHSDTKGWLIYGVSAAGFTVLCWPYLWPSPLMRFVEVFGIMSKFPHIFPVLYLGRFYLPANLPLDYAFVWIAVSTPLSVLVLFLIGLLDLRFLVRDLVLRTEKSQATALLPYVWFGLPLAAVLILHSPLYNGWRQLYFIYPAMVMISVRGLLLVWNTVKTVGARQVRRAALIAVVGIVGLDLTGVGAFMVKWHPHQYLYFNSIIGGVRGAVGKMEWDYFGVAHRDLLECLLREHRGKRPIPVLGCDPTYYNLAILEPKKRAQLRLVGVIETAFRYLKPPGLVLDDDTYYLSDLRGGKPGWTGSTQSACKVTVAGGTVAKAIRLRSKKDNSIRSR